MSKFTPSCGFWSLEADTMNGEGETGREGKGTEVSGYLNEYYCFVSIRTAQRAVFR